MLRVLGAACALLMLGGSAAAQTKSVSKTPGEAAPSLAPTRLPEGAILRSVALAKVSDNIKQGAEFYFVGWGSRCAQDSIETWDRDKHAFERDQASDRAFRDELTALGFKVAGDPDNLFQRESNAGGDGAELQVGALVQHASVAVCYGFTRADRRLPADEAPGFGKAIMRVEWQIYSPLESRVVARMATSAEVESESSSADEARLLLARAFAANVRALGGEKAFRDAVLSLGPAAGLARPTSAPTIALARAAGPPRPISDAPASVVALFTGDAMGSGFLVSSDGYVITNRHVVGGSKFLKVKWSDGFESIGEVVRSDPGRDVALIKTDPRGRRPLGLRSGVVAPGSTVFAVGTPLDPRLQGTLTRGVISANRTLSGYDFIQSDVVVNPGNSGGPLLDEAGQVIGVTVAGIGQDSAPRGINFFIPIDDALAFLSVKSTP